MARLTASLSLLLPCSWLFNSTFCVSKCFCALLLWLPLLLLMKLMLFLFIFVFESVRAENSMSQTQLEYHGTCSKAFVVKQTDHVCWCVWMRISFWGRTTYTSPVLRISCDVCCHSAIPELPVTGNTCKGAIIERNPWLTSLATRNSGRASTNERQIADTPPGNRIKTPHKVQLLSSLKGVFMLIGLLSRGTP